MGLRSLSNLQQRVIAAVIAVPFLMFCVLYSDYTFLVLFLVIGILAQLEFYKLVGSISDNLPLTFYGTFCGVVMHVLTFFIEKGDLAYQYYYILSPLLTLIFFIKLYKSKDEKPFKNIAYTFLGIIYVALPFTLLTVLAYIKMIPTIQTSCWVVYSCCGPVIQELILRERNLGRPNYLSVFRLRNLGKGVLAG